MELPLIAFVHGALTDASVWNGVSGRLRRQGYTTFAPALPLRGLHSDAAFLASTLEDVASSIILVGHSYGGSVISHPAVARTNIRALVYVAAFAPDTGESTSELNGRWPGSKLNENAILIRKRPDGSDLYVKPDYFGDLYAGDLSEEAIGIMAAAQRPIDPTALGESFDGTPVWRNVPSWTLVATHDCSLVPEAQRFMAKRANSTTVEVSASHAAPVSKPDEVANLIVSATPAALVSVKAPRQVG